MNEKELIHRLNRIQGQIEGLKRNIEKEGSEKNCKEIIYQTKAIHSAIKKFSEKYTSLHLENCLNKKNNKNLKKDIKDAIVMAFKI